MTPWYRARFLFCSFGPLYLLLCIELAVQHKWSGEIVYSGKLIAIIISGCAFIMSILIFLELRSGFSAASPFRCKVQRLESLDESVLGYMLSYIPPLMIDDLSLIAKIAPAIVFYAVLILILLRTDTMYVNPYFLIFKYRVFRVELPSGRPVIIITKKKEILRDDVLVLHEIQQSKLYYAS